MIALPVFQLEVPSNRRHQNAQQGMLAVLSGLLLSLPFLFADLFLIAWLALVPLLLSIQQASLVRTYILGLICGLSFFISAGYWISDFLMLSKAYSLLKSNLWGLVFWLYSAQLFAFIALLFQWLRSHTRCHELVLFPVVLVTLNALFPALFSARLGDSQSQFLSAIQGIEFTGVHGLDALIALSNIGIYMLLFQPLKPCTQKNTQRPLRYIGVAAGLILSWLVYGWFTTERWNDEIEHWQTVRIGIVQPNEVPDLGPPKYYPGYSQTFPAEMDMSKRLVTGGAGLVIWPEAKYKGYFDHPRVREAYAKQVSSLGVPLLFQDLDQSIAAEEKDKHATFNSAALLGAQGELANTYAKIKRIPLGEYVPWADELPSLKTLVNAFFGEFLNDIAQGRSQHSFTVQDKALVPLICYETMFPEFVAGAVSTLKTGGIITALSSDGWFGNSLQPYQHIYSSVLRAVENRVPLIHALNKGPSIAALPNGRIIFISEYHKAGGYLVDLPHSGETQRSFYTRHPHAFINSVYILFITVFSFALWRNFRSRT